MVFLLAGVLSLLCYLFDFTGYHSQNHVASNKTSLRLPASVSYVPIGKNLPRQALLTVYRGIFRVGTHGQSWLTFGIFRRVSSLDMVLLAWRLVRISDF